MFLAALKCSCTSALDIVPWPCKLRHWLFLSQPENRKQQCSTPMKVQHNLRGVEEVANWQHPILAEAWLHLWQFFCSYWKNLANNDPAGVILSTASTRHRAARSGNSYPQTIWCRLKRTCLLNWNSLLVIIFLILKLQFRGWVYRAYRTSQNLTHMPNLGKRNGHFTPFSTIRLRFAPAAVGVLRFVLDFSNN